MNVSTSTTTVNIWSDPFIGDSTDTTEPWVISDYRSQIISFYIKGSPDEPILKIDETGFYVRGKRVPQDANEAKIVYDIFHQHITWSTLNR